MGQFNTYLLLFRFVYVYILLSSFAGAHINTKDRDHLSPLHFAAAFGNRGVTKLLLEKGEFTFFSA